MTGSTKYIFVTGGVTSSLGKGIISASLAKLLQARGFTHRRQPRPGRQCAPLDALGQACGQLLHQGKRAAAQQFKGQFVGAVHGRCAGRGIQVRCTGIVVSTDC